MFFNLSFLKSVTQLIFSFFYMLVGLKHFTNPDIFLKIVPPYLPKKLELVYLSGLFEILFGFVMLLVLTFELFKNKTTNSYFKLLPTNEYFYPKLQKLKFYNSLCLILLLIAVFPANYYLFSSEIARESFGSITKEQALIRMFFQPMLIATAYWHGTNLKNQRLSRLMLVIAVITIFYFAIILN